MKNNASKKLTVLALFITLIFAGINIFWMITMYIPYCGYSYSLAQYRNENLANKQEEKYFFKISETPYLGYDDYLSVSIEVTDDMKGIVIDGVYIYPNIWGDYEYAVSCTENGDSFFMIEIDDLGNFIPLDENDTEFNEKAQQILNDKHVEIIQFIKTAKDCWGLEAKHDLEIGLKGMASDISVVAVIVIACALCLITAVLIWLLKCKLPFQSKFAAEMDAVYGTKEFGFKRTAGDYEFYLSNPQLFKNNGFLMAQKHKFSVDRISLVIYPDEKGAKYFVLIGDTADSVRKAEKIKLEYVNKKVICSNLVVREHSEEIEDLIIQSSLFWGSKIRKALLLYTEKH